MSDYSVVIGGFDAFTYADVVLGGPAVFPTDFDSLRDPWANCA